MNDLLGEQTSLRVDLTGLASEVLAQKKMSTRAWCEAELSKMKNELKEYKEKCFQEVQQQVNLPFQELITAT